MKKLILLAGLYCLQPNLQASRLTSSNNFHETVKRDDHGTSRASERAQAHFRENFADARHPQWSMNADNSINCIFHQREKVYRVYYDRRGVWTYTLIGYLPSELSNSIKYRVLESFDGYNIAYVNEIRSENNEPVYIINIENAYNIKVIRVSNNDEIGIQQEFQKK
jgi:hypothetical protein